MDHISFFGPSGSGKSTLEKSLTAMLKALGLTTKSISVSEVLKNFTEESNGSPELRKYVAGSISTGKFIDPRLTAGLILPSYLAPADFIITEGVRDALVLQLINKIKPIDMALIFEITEEEALLRMQKQTGRDDAAFALERYKRSTQLLAELELVLGEEEIPILRCHIDKHLTPEENLAKIIQALGGDNFLF